MLKKISMVVMILGYLIAGANHFYNPVSYYRIIPSCIPYPVLVNILAGIVEIAFALLLLLPKTRLWAAWGIIIMLAAFLPVHINMLVNAPYKLSSFTVSPLAAWVRLVLQPVLMLWAWWHREA